MTCENREILNRASGILEGLSVIENLTDAETSLIIAVANMIGDVLKKESA